MIDNPLLAVPVVAADEYRSPARRVRRLRVRDLIPIVDALNKISADMLTASEYGARPPPMGDGAGAGGAAEDRRQRGARAR